MATLLPASGTRYIEITDGLNGIIANFGSRFMQLLGPALKAAGGKGCLQQIEYSDRYLQSPLTVRLLSEVLGALRDNLADRNDELPVRVVTNRLRANERQPFAPDHDWQFEGDRAAVLLGLLKNRGFAPELVEQGAGHGRIMTLKFNEATVRVVLDQGFGPWRTPRYAKWDHFGEGADQQLRHIERFNAMIEARGASYVVVTA